MYLSIIVDNKLKIPKGAPWNVLSVKMWLRLRSVQIVCDMYVAQDKRHWQMVQILPEWELEANICREQN